MNKELHHIKKAAADFRKQNDLTQTKRVDLDALLKDLGVLTVFRPLDTSFSGMALKAGEHRFMLINSDQTLGRQNFTIAHELFHLYVQTDFTSMVCNTGKFEKKDIIEYEADWFAAYLLLPEDKILSLIPEEEIEPTPALSLSTIVELEQYFQISRSALLVRLQSLKLMDAKTAEEYKNNVKKSALALGFPVSLYEKAVSRPTIGDYGQKAFNLFNKELISESHYASLMCDLGVDVSNFNELLEQGE